MYMYLPLSQHLKILYVTKTKIIQWITSWNIGYSEHARDVSARSPSQTKCATSTTPVRGTNFDESTTLRESVDSRFNRKHWYAKHQRKVLALSNIGSVTRLNYSLPTCGNTFDNICGNLPSTTWCANMRAASYSNKFYWMIKDLTHWIISLGKFRNRYIIDMLFFRNVLKSHLSV